MNESFGTRLRRERERKEISLASIASSTKIALGLLEALEDDNVSHWPSGIFRRAYFRSYAQAIGLDPDAAVREFLELYPDPHEIDAALQSAPEEAASRPGSSAYGGRSLRDGLAAKSVAESASWILRKLRTATRSDLGTGGARDFVEPCPAPQIASPADGRLPADHTQRMPDFSAAANLCTELARVIEPDDVPPLLQRLADLLDAVGVVVWLSDRTGQKLTPAMACGYPDSMVARISNVQRTAQNATAAAFRSAQPEIVTATDAANGAIAIPLMTPTGCAGVLAAEIKHGGEQSEWVSAVARIFAAQLGMLIATPSAEVRRAHA